MSVSGVELGMAGKAGTASVRTHTGYVTETARGQIERQREAARETAGDDGQASETSQ